MGESCHELDDLGAERLLTAILKQAHRDLTNAREVLREDPGNITAQVLRYDVEKFYRSKWFEAIWRHQCISENADPDRLRMLERVQSV